MFYLNKNLKSVHLGYRVGFEWVSFGSVTFRIRAVVGHGRVWSGRLLMVQLKINNSSY